MRPSVYPLNEPVDELERTRHPMVLKGVRVHGRPQLAHQRGGLQPVAHDIADRQSEATP
jgi:hypothetical protein